MRILTPLLAVSVITLYGGGASFANDTSTSSGSSKSDTSSNTDVSHSSDTQSGQLGYDNPKLKGQQGLNENTASDQNQQASSDQSSQSANQGGQAGTAGGTATADSGTSYGSDMSSSSSTGTMGTTSSSGDMGGGQPGTADTTAGTTTATTGEVTKGYLKSEGVSVRPQLGVIAYRDNTLTDTARAAGGIGLDWNAAKLFSLGPSVYVGPSSGFIYSHLGSSTSNFFWSCAYFLYNQS